MTLIGGAVLGGAGAFPLGAGAQPSSSGTPSSGTLDGVLRKGVEDKSVVGVVAMATDRKGPFYQGAFGVADAATGRPLAMDALFRIASMTKAITSTAAMQLIERGRVGLDDPVEKYLPAFAHLQVFESIDPATGAYQLHPARSIATVRHLMTHTSGLGYPFTSATLRDFKPRPDDDYPIGPLLFEPGTRWHYGTSTDWLGKVVEAVSGRPLDEYFRLRVTGPLGMADTFYNVPADKQARLVAVHHRGPDGIIVKDDAQPGATINPIVGGGGLASTAADYIRFVRMILNDGALDGVRILKADTVAAMGQNAIGNLGVPALKSALTWRSDEFSFIADGRDKWGLGFLITVDDAKGKRSAGSLSWGGIYNTYFWIDRARGIGGVILTQFLPFADRKALALYDGFERGVYQLADAVR
jgi:methyl acetate hydrolase